MPKCFNRFCIKRECQKAMVSPVFISNEGVNCLCDSACIIYGDCCPDFYSACLDGANSSRPVLPGNYEWVTNQVKSLTNIRDIYRFSMILFKYKTCFTKKSGMFSEHIWVIGECPESYNISSVAYKCQNQNADVIGSIPATHRIYKFITFKNVFCAMCHDVLLSDLDMWETSLKCLPNIEQENITFHTLLELLNRKRCFFKLRFPRMIKFRFCHISNVTDSTFTSRNHLGPTTLKTMTAITTQSSNVVEINETNLPVNVTFANLLKPDRVLQLCGAYRYLVSDSCSIYRNVHCSYRQSNVHCSYLQSNVSGETYDCVSFSCPKSDFQPYYVSLGIVFSFTEQSVMLCDSATTCMGPNQKECLVDEVYDYYLNQCRQLVCPVGRLPINGSCVINGSLMGDLQLQMFPRGFQVIQVNITYNNDSCEINDRVFKEKMFLACLTAGIKTIENETSNSVLTNTSGHMITLILSLIDGQIHISYKEHTYNYTSQFLNTLFKVINESCKDSGSVAEVTVSTFSNNEDLGCVNNTRDVDGSGTLEENDGSWLVYHDPLYYPLENIPFIVKVGPNDPDVGVVVYTVCEMDSGQLDCSMISYPENQTENQNKTLHILGTDLYFSFGSFVFQENRVYVCSNFSRNYLSTEIVQFFKFNPTQGLVTLACSVSSVFSLTLTLIIYFTSPELRNIPGKIVMAVSVSLLTSQTLLLLINIPTGIFCKVFGIVLHWTWLSTFVWMTMMAANLVKTFTAKSPALHSNRPFSFYVVIAVSVPALIVGA